MVLLLMTITQMASGDRTLCPVWAAAAIVKRVKKYPGSSQQTPISTVLNHGIIKHITSDHIIDALRNVVGAIGEEKLGFQKEDVGTHSIRSGEAMAMYLGECPVFMIMLIGCWSSDAFLRYIRKQVMEFSQNMAKKMLSCQNFRHIPDIHTRVPSDDLHIQNHPSNAETRRNVGGDSSCRVRLPPFALFSWASAIWVVGLTIDGGNTSEGRSGIGGGGFKLITRTSIQTQPIRQDTLFWMLCIFHILHITGTSIRWSATRQRY